MIGIPEQGWATALAQVLVYLRQTYSSDVHSAGCVLTYSSLPLNHW
jgi:hypothetical protein